MYWIHELKVQKKMYSKKTFLQYVTKQNLLLTINLSQQHISKIILGRISNLLLILPIKLFHEGRDVWVPLWIGYLRILPDNILLAQAFNSVKLSRFQGESFKIFCYPSL